MSSDINEEKYYETRLKICKRCPRLFRPTMQCKECGCFMRVKARLKSASCPIGKW